jgi:hypothetical protein
MRLTVVAIAVAALGGCALAWGKPYKVEFTSPSSITINYDPVVANMGEMQQVAQAHCAQYQRDAIPGTSQMSAWGLTTTSFTCQQR